MFSYDRTNETRIEQGDMFRRVRQVAVPVRRQTTTVIGRVRQNAAPGGRPSLLSMIALYCRRLAKSGHHAAYILTNTDQYWPL